MRGLIIMSNRLDFNQLSGYTVRKDLSGQWPDFKSTDFSWTVWKQFSSAPVEGRQTNVDHRFLMSNVSVMAQASGNKLISDVTSKRIAVQWWAILVAGPWQQQHSRRNATRRAAVGRYSVQKCTCEQKWLQALGVRDRRLEGAWLQLGGCWTPLAGLLWEAGARRVCLSERAKTGPLRAKAPQWELWARARCPAEAFPSRSAGRAVGEGGCGRWVRRSRPLWAQPVAWASAGPSPRRRPAAGWAGSLLLHGCPVPRVALSLVSKGIGRLGSLCLPKAARPQPSWSSSGLSASQASAIPWSILHGAGTLKNVYLAVPRMF